MTTLTITLPDERVAELQALAARSGLSVEELLARGVEHLLAQPREDFARAARHILDKNAALYRRLAPGCELT